MPRDLADGRQCTAHKKNKEQCGNPAIIGGNVCRFHGGAAKQVRAKAQERIDQAAYKMVGVLIGLAEDAEIEPKDRINAVKELLNRTAEVRQPNTEVKVSGGVTVSPAYLALVEQAKATILRQGDEPYKGKVFSIEDIVDAEEVD